VARHVAPPNWRARRYRVLYIRDDRIGDIIISTGLIRAVATSHPTITVDVLTQPASAEMLRGNPHVGAVIRFDKRRKRTYAPAFWRLARGRYDVVIDGMIVRPKVSTTTSLLMLATRAPYRIGIGSRINGQFTLPVPAPDPTLHHCEQSAVFALPFGVDPAGTDWTPELFLADAERAAGEATWARAAGGRGGAPGRRVLVNVSASMPSRQLSEDRYVTVVRHLRARESGARLLVMGAPAEAARVERIAREGGAMPATPGLRDALGVVAAADVVFTANTSVVHMAAAFRKPTVLVHPRAAEDFGLGNLDTFYAYRAPGRTVVWPAWSLADVPMEPVLRALDHVLAGTPPEYAHVRI
jgi:ADP-heptose:LPS heptosyltransferase